MKWIRFFNLFLLDFDGLLVNTEHLHFASYQLLCRRRGFTLSWDFDHYCTVAHVSSSGLREALYAEFPQLKEKESDWEVLYEEKKQIYMELLKEGKLSLMPGVEQLLKELLRMQVKRCVVTHSSCDQVNFIKQKLPILETIPVWITREHYDRPKPAPDAYLKAIELLAEPDECIIGFEDSLRGIRALQAAHATPVLICPKTHSQLKDPALLGIAHFTSFEAIPRSFRDTRL